MSSRYLSTGGYVCLLGVCPFCEASVYRAYTCLSLCLFVFYGERDYVASFIFIAFLPGASVQLVLSHSIFLARDD